MFDSCPDINCDFFTSPLIWNRCKHHKEEVNHLSSTERKFKLPLFLSKATTSPPSIDPKQQNLSPNDYLITNRENTFVVKAKGDSMIDAGIFKDDMLIVDKSITPLIGDIVLAVLNEEFIVRYIGENVNGMVLIPANKNYKVIEVKVNSSFEVWGVVTGSMRKFK